MKISIVLGILNLAAAVSCWGQGYILLDNQETVAYGTPILYGSGVPADGVSGALGTEGAGLSYGWTVGLYWAPGITGLSQAAGSDMPDASLTPGTGIGSTAQVAGALVFGLPGYYCSAPAFNTGSTLNTMITLEMVAYPTAAGSYAAALCRSHSAAFTMPTATATAGVFPATGYYMPGQMVVETLIPEPATLVLGGLGLATLFAFRRKVI